MTRTGHNLKRRHDEITTEVGPVPFPSVPRFPLAAKTAARLSLAELKEVIHIFFSGISSRFMGLKDKVKQMRPPIQNKGRGLGLFRNACGSQADLLGNKASCQSGTPGPQRFKYGTIPPSFIFGETPGAANCPVFLK